MDCGGFNRGGNSVSTSFSDAPGRMTSLSSTPNNYFNSFGFCPSQVTTDSIGHSGSANQKLDQLLFLFNEQKAQNRELRIGKEVSALKEQISELLKKQACVQDSVINVVRRGKPVKLPLEVSVSTIIVSSSLLASFFNVHIKLNYVSLSVNSFTTIVQKSILPLRDRNRAYMHGFQRSRSNVILVNTEF